MQRKHENLSALRGHSLRCVNCGMNSAEVTTENGFWWNAPFWCSPSSKRSFHVVTWENLKEKKAYVLFERTFFEVVPVARKCVNKILQNTLQSRGCCFVFALRMFRNEFLCHLSFCIFCFLFCLDVQKGCDNHYDGVRRHNNCPDNKDIDQSRTQSDYILGDRW